MANIQKLLEPINRENTVNIINIYKEDYLPNIYVNPKKIKGKQYSNNYIITNPKVGERKIKDFVNSRIQGPFGIVSKAVSIKKKFFLPKTDVEKYMFILTASKEDLKKVKPEDYFGLRLSNNTLFDFDKRLIFHNVEADEEGRIKVDKEDSEPMIDMLKYQSIFINKKNYKPIQRYNVNYDFETPNFVIKQQEGAEPSFVFKDSENNDIEDSDEIDINTLYDDYYNAENQLRNYSLYLMSKYLGPEMTTIYFSTPINNIIDLVEKYRNEKYITDTQYKKFLDYKKNYNFREQLIRQRQNNQNNYNIISDEDYLH